MHSVKTLGTLLTSILRYTSSLSIFMVKTLFWFSTVMSTFQKIWDLPELLAGLIQSISTIVALTISAFVEVTATCPGKKIYVKAPIIMPQISRANKIFTLVHRGFSRSSLYGMRATWKSERIIWFLFTYSSRHKRVDIVSDVLQHVVQYLK